MILVGLGSRASDDILHLRCGVLLVQCVEFGRSEQVGCGAAGRVFGRGDSNVHVLEHTGVPPSLVCFAQPRDILLRILRPERDPRAQVQVRLRFPDTAPEHLLWLHHLVLSVERRQYLLHQSARHPQSRPAPLRALVPAPWVLALGHSVCVLQWYPAPAAVKDRIPRP
ncbi:hypothetical protein AYI70_g10945 [Smittium culicis]|uniref:Uncharacterized protein n=1 Tax=Smittium culicis TaxID=133412 RepID=A0A1R1X467_9FUNG|nr:hypothetical protein AYI70_g10945 [Smittium culicis]